MGQSARPRAAGCAPCALQLGSQDDEAPAAAVDALASPRPSAPSAAGLQAPAERCVRAALARVRCAQRPGTSGSSSAAACLAQALMDGAHAAHAAHRWQGRCVAVSWTSYNDGMGDAVTAAKVAWLLAPRVRVQVWVPAGCGARALFAFLPAEQVMDAVATAASLPAVDLVVWVNALTQLSERMVRQDRQLPVLHVLEYDVIVQPFCPHVLQTGFGPETCGFFAAPAPPAHSLALAPAPPCWQQLSAAVGLSLGPPARLHTCYPAFAPLSLVLAGCLRFHRGQASDLDILVVAKHLSTTLAQARALPPRSRLELWSCSPQGACRLQVPRPAAVPGPSESTAGRCRLLLSGVLEGAAFASALALSDFAVVTGDQSLSEAMALQVPFALDAPPHKHRSKARLADLVGASVQPRLAAHARSALGEDLPGCVDSWWAPGVRPALTAGFQQLCEHLDVADRLLGRCLQRLSPPEPMAEDYGRLLRACQPPWDEPAVARLQQLVAGMARRMGQEAAG